ncbi:hypothetical protein [Paenibacillus xylanexedens]|uniref:hypothetical protein n=1 Tax=Paenibacillus xylanexedens TaxID=528191 RepID=UPI0011A8CB76|nr:hypothetical protein [Paenibacillus xylanexedens]
MRGYPQAVTAIDVELDSLFVVQELLGSFRHTKTQVPIVVVRRDLAGVAKDKASGVRSVLRLQLGFPPPLYPSDLRPDAAFVRVDGPAALLLVPVYPSLHGITR